MKLAEELWTKIKFRNRHNAADRRQDTVDQWRVALMQWWQSNTFPFDCHHQKSNSPLTYSILLPSTYSILLPPTRRALKTAGKQQWEILNLNTELEIVLMLQARIPMNGHQSILM